MCKHKEIYIMRKYKDDIKCCIVVAFIPLESIPGQSSKQGIRPDKEMTKGPTTRTSRTDPDKAWTKAFAPGSFLLLVVRP